MLGFGDFRDDAPHAVPRRLFADTEHIPLNKAEGRVGAEMGTPYPLGIPAITSGGVFADTVISYLRKGVY